MTHILEHKERTKVGNVEVEGIIKIDREETLNNKTRGTSGEREIVINLYIIPFLTLRYIPA